MPTELLVLTLAALLQIVQLALYAIPANRELGPKWTAGPRDTPPPRALSVVPQRLHRAYQNHQEALVLFAIAALVVVLAHKSSALTAACAWVYLAARVLYVPAYAFGWTPGRSLIWAVGALATLVMLIAALV